MLCSASRNLTAAEGSVSERLSILTIMRVLEESLGRSVRLLIDADVGSRTPAMTIATGLAR